MAILLKEHVIKSQHKTQGKHSFAVSFGAPGALLVRGTSEDTLLEVDHIRLSRKHINHLPVFLSPLYTTPQRKLHSYSERFNRKLQ